MTRRTRQFLLFASACLAIVAGSACVCAASSDERYLEGLRQRRLYELAEKYCDDRLADPALDATRRSELTIELIRSLSEHALEAGGDVATGLWKRATSSAAEYAAQHPNDSRLLLVRLQGALAHAAEGESRRIALGDEINPEATTAVRDAHRRAIAEFEQLERQVADALRRASKPSTTDGGLGTAELQSLQVNLQFQLAKALISQAQSYPVGSADRINALSRAGESLQRIARQKSRTPLVWSAALEELSRLRLLGEYSTAESRIAELAGSQPPAVIASRLQAERIRLALARERLDDALAEAGTATQAKQGPDVDLARLEAQLAAWRRASGQHLDDEATEWQHRATEQAAAIGRNYGGQWMRQAEGLVAATLQGSGFTQSANTLTLTAAGFYRSGQLDKAIATFDQAARAARDERQTDRAFEAAYSAATIEKERQNYRAAADRYRQLALDAPQHGRAAAVHLLAAYCVAQLAQLEKPPKLDEYRSLLREHVLNWPKGETASQAYSWLGRVAENRGDWNEAIETLSQVKQVDPQFAEAAAAIGRCYEAKLAELHARGQDGRALANDSLAALERIISSARARGVKSDAATRAATLSAARIWLTELPTGAFPAEQLLQDALKAHPAAPEDWQMSARRWLVPALVMQGKGGHADQALDVVTKSPADALTSLDVLSLVRRRQAGSDGARKLAVVELRLEGKLLARGAELDGETLRSVQRRRAITLAETGKRQEGLAALQAMADEYPRDGQTHEDLANLLMAGNDGDVRAALTKWTQVAEKSRPGTPRFFRAYCGLAQTQLKLGQRRAAVATVQAVTDKYPQLGGVVMKPRFEQILAEAK